MCDGSGYDQPGMRIVLASLLLCSFACGGSAKGVRGPTLTPVEDASLPYRIVQARTGRELTHEEFYAELADKKAVCVGESHTDAHHHWAQLTIADNLARQGGAFATGYEMFQRPFQGVLDDYAQGKIDETTLLLRSDWKRRWSHDWAFYAPIVRLTVQRGGSLVALNISMELKDKWKRDGTAGLSEADRAKIPELDLNDETHRRWFRSLMESIGGEDGHGGTDHSNHAFWEQPAAPAPSPMPPNHPPVASGSDAHDDAEAPGEEEGDFIDRIYPVQVLWDETMADSAVRWLNAEEGRRMVILAGHGHCHDSAIVGRMKRRGLNDVVSVRPVVETGNGEVADLLSDPENDYLFVMDKPSNE